MIRLNRISCLLLALVLGLGAVVLAAHPVIHAGQGGGQCLVCSTHAGEDEIVLADVGSVAVEAPECSGPEPAPSPTKIRQTACQILPRAPPAAA